MHVVRDDDPAATHELSRAEVTSREVAQPSRGTLEPSRADEIRQPTPVTLERSHEDDVGQAKSAMLDESRGEGSCRSLSSGDVLHLESAEHLWLVKEGRVDVFATPAGRRRFLFTVDAGGALFGGQRLLAVAAGAVELTSLSKRGPAYAAAIEGWVRGLGRNLAMEHGAPRIVEPDANGDLVEAPANAVIGSERLLWVAPISGTGRLLDRAELTELSPLPPGAWVRASEPLELAVIDTATYLAADPEAAAVDRFQHLALELIEDRERTARTQDAEITETRARADRDRFSSSLAELAAVAGEFDAPSRPAAESGPIERAAVLALRAAGIELSSTTLETARRSKLAELPAGETDGSTWTRAFERGVARLLRAGGVQKRWVALKGDWWKSECGPLISATKSRRIVALLPSSRGSSYIEVDVESGDRRPLTAERAAALLPFAFLPYRPLADRPLGITSLFTFALRGSQKELAFLLVTGTLIGLLGAAPAFFSRALFDSVIPGGERGQLLLCCLGLIICALCSAAIGLGRAFATLRIEEKISGAVQTAIWDRLFKLPVTFFRAYSAGDLAARANSVDRIRRVFSGAAITALMAGATAAVSVLVMAWTDLSMALVAVAIAAIAAIITAVVLIRVYVAAASTADHAGRTASLSLQLLNGISKLRVAGAERRAFSAWVKRFAPHRSAQLRERKLVRAIETFHRVYPLAAIAVMFYALSSSATALGTGALLGFIVAFGSFLAAVAQIFDSALKSVLAIPHAARVAPILATRPESSERIGAPIALRGEVEVTRLGFRYGPEGPPVLDDVSFRARPGELIAFVGPSGSGKSTLLRLLLGFERPTTGAIFYDGQDLSRLDRDDVRRQMGVVLQGGEVLDATIRENIGGGVNIPKEDALEAARIAAFDKDLEKMPLGLNTRLAQAGASLSGGQRQRLVLARAVARRPKILLLDEATSALDNATQAEVRRNLATLAATRIVIAHRLSTVQDADRIYVLDRGRIVQSGTFAQLIAAPGLFRELAQRQLD